MRPSISVICLFFLAASCNNKPQRRFQPYNNNLDALFHSGSPGKWSNQLYKPEDVFDSNSPVYKKLVDVGILNENSKIMFSSPDCVSIINRKQHFKTFIKDNNFSDTIVMFNGNEGKFACGINDIYTMNQDESILSLHISVYKIDAAINLFIIKN